MCGVINSLHEERMSLSKLSKQLSVQGGGGGRGAGNR